MGTKEHYPAEFDYTVQDQYGRQAPTDPNSFGVEIEVEGVPDEGLDWPRALPGVWQTHRDDSLRGGIEFVSNGGRALPDLGPDLDALQTTFQALNFTPVFSYRTSLHVHMNVNNMTYKQIVNLFTLYTIFEPALIDFGGEERRGNVHCLTVHDNNWVVDMVRSWCNGTNPQALNTLMHRDRRYAAFNWASIPVHGTIEFRSHRGTADRDTVVNWATLLSDMKAYATQATDPQSITAEFSNLGPRTFTEAVFPNVKPFQNFAGKYEQALWDGVRLAQEVAFCRESWSRPEKAKKDKKATYTSTQYDPGLLADIVGRAGRRRGAEMAPPDLHWLDAVAQLRQPPQPVIRVFDEDGYDAEGYDRNGYDREGYDENGWNEDGFNEDGEHRDDD